MFKDFTNIRNMLECTYVPVKHLQASLMFESKWPFKEDSLGAPL
jgi:hypothetical protein